jgi:homocysteine S-methyltransferase
MTAMMANNPLAPFLQNDSVLILDGGLATELERRGADLNDPLWSAKLLIERPDMIRNVHLDYFKAGADVATTGSFQATFEGLAKRGLDPDAAAALMRASVTLAIEAREEFWSDRANRNGRRKPLVAASIGPYGAMLADGSEYRGGYRLAEEALMEFHRPRMRVLADSGADLLACETIPCLAEARALARLLAEFPAMGAWISFSCRDGRHDSQGELLADCAQALESFDPLLGIGVNCTAPQFIESLIAELKPATSKPIAVYPNSGEQYDASTRHWHGCAISGKFADAAHRWRSAGARLIGGCCRTTPDDIRALKEALAVP